MWPTVFQVLTWLISLQVCYVAPLRDAHTHVVTQQVICPMPETQLLPTYGNDSGVFDKARGGTGYVN